MFSIVTVHVVTLYQTSLYKMFYQMFQEVILVLTNSCSPMHTCVDNNTIVVHVAVGCFYNSSIIHMPALCAYNIQHLKVIKINPL